MSADGREPRLSLLSRRQGGAFTAVQAVNAGYSPATIRRRVAAGTWERALPGVYVLGGTEPTRVRDLWVAALAVGSMGTITHESSVLINGGERLTTRPITLSVPHRWHHRLSGLVVHQIDDLLPAHRMLWRGLSVSTPARAVVELAATQPADVIGRVADDLVASKATSIGAISAVFASVARPGKPGMAKLARVLEARGDGYVPPASELERALFSALAAGGLPGPARQVPLPSDGRITGIVDAAYRHEQVILEADGRRWHDRIRAAKADRERDAAAARVGWQTLRFVYEQIVHAPDEVCATVDDVLSVRRRQLRLAS